MGTVWPGLPPLAKKNSPPTTTTAGVPRRMAVWTPALVETLSTILGVTILSLVALGQWQLARQKTWRDAAEGKDSIIRDLQLQLADARREADEARKTREVLMLRMEALEAQVAEVQRQNHRLQMQLDKAEAAHARSESRHAEQRARDHGEQ